MYREIDLNLLLYPDTSKNSKTFEKLQFSVDIPVGDISVQQLILAGGQSFRNSNLAGSFPTLTSVKDGAAPHLAHIVCSALRYFQTKAAQGTF